MAVYIVGMIVGTTCTVASLVYLLGINLLAAKLALNKIDIASVSGYFHVPLAVGIAITGVALTVLFAVGVALAQRKASRPEPKPAPDAQSQMPASDESASDEPDIDEPAADLLEEPEL